MQQLIQSRQPCNCLCLQQIFTVCDNVFLHFATQQKTVQYHSSSYHITWTILMPALACLKIEEEGLDAELPFMVNMEIFVPTKGMFCQF